MKSSLNERKSRPQNGYLTLFVGAVVVSMGVFTFMLIGPLAGSGSNSGAALPSYNGNSIAAFLQKLESSTRIMDFTENATFTSLDHQYDRLWDDHLIPNNGGYLTANKKTSNTDKLGISMFHQLHCLAMLREEMQNLHEVIDAAAMGKSPAMHNDEHQRGLRDGPVVDTDAGRVKHHDQKHTMHCFDYLRQVRRIYQHYKGAWGRFRSRLTHLNMKKTILCTADSTIERPKLTENGTPFIDGLGPRKCRDWDLWYAASAGSDDVPMVADDLR